MAFLAASLLDGSAITLPATPPGDNGQVFELVDYRWVPVVIRRTPTSVDCSFAVVTGAPTVSAELISESDFTRFNHNHSYEKLAATPMGRAGQFQRLLETPGRYLVLIRNLPGAPPVAVSLVLRTDVDPQGLNIPASVSPLRRFIVILGSLMIFSGTVLWSGRKLLRAYRSR